MAMIEKMIKLIKPYLPLKIKEVNWDGATFQLIDYNWNFTTLSAWRVSLDDKIIYTCYDECSHKFFENLKNQTIIDIECQSDFLKIDPIFHLSNGQSIEIFSTFVIDPWTFEVSGLSFYVPTPSEPSVFESCFK